jgi:hypothetical protein
MRKLRPAFRNSKLAVEARETATLYDNFKGLTRAVEASEGHVYET